MSSQTLSVRSADTRTRLTGAVSVAAGTAAISWHASYYDSWVVDDAAITFGYARSMTEGLGPVVHPGAPEVEGFSNPAWLVLLGVGRLAGLFDRGAIFGVPDYVLFPKVLAALCCAGILWVCRTVLRRVTSRPELATVLVGLILAAIPSFVIWCFSGLENPLFALAVVGLAALLFHAVRDHRLDRVAVAAGLICALAALTRPDGLIYLLAYPLLVRRRKPVLLFGAAFAIPFGAYLLWRLVTFGLFVPNTAVAKRQGLPGLDDVVRLWDLVSYASIPATVVFVALLVATRRVEGLQALLVPLGLAVLAYGLLEPDWMAQHRFATPVWALAALVAVVAATRVPRRPAIVVVVVAALVMAGTGFASAARRFHDNPTFPVCLVAERFGRMFNQYADILGIEQGSVLLPDLGGSAMTTRLRLVDMAGLADARIAQYTRVDDMAGLRDHVFEEVAPTFITSHGVWNGGTGVAHDPRLQRDYHVIYRDDTASDWVRKDAVPNLGKLSRVRDFAAEAVPTVDKRIDELPRRRCGDTLWPGQVNAAGPR